MPRHDCVFFPKLGMILPFPPPPPQPRPKAASSQSADGDLSLLFGGARDHFLPDEADGGRLEEQAIFEAEFLMHKVRHMG